MLLTILELRKRMLNCNPISSITVEFVGEEGVKLGWTWEGADGGTHTYHIDVVLQQISVSNRSFERQMHKAKRYMKHGVYHG